MRNVRRHLKLSTTTKKFFCCWKNIEPEEVDTNCTILARAIEFTIQLASFSSLSNWPTMHTNDARQSWRAEQPEVHSWTRRLRSSSRYSSSHSRPHGWTKYRRVIHNGQQPCAGLGKIYWSQHSMKLFAKSIRCPSHRRWSFGCAARVLFVECDPSSSPYRASDWVSVSDSDIVWAILKRTKFRILSIYRAHFRNGYIR